METTISNNLWGVFMAGTLVVVGAAIAPATEQLATHREVLTVNSSNLKRAVAAKTIPPVAKPQAAISPALTPAPTPTPVKAASRPQPVVAAPVPADWAARPGFVEQWRPLVAKHFPAASVHRALQIMHCESGGNPNAVGDRSTAYASYGLFQIRALPGRPQGQTLLTPEFNVRYAADMFKAQGWQPWTCSRLI